MLQRVFCLGEVSHLSEESYTLITCIRSLCDLMCFSFFVEPGWDLSMSCLRLRFHVLVYCAIVWALSEFWYVFDLHRCCSVVATATSVMLQMQETPLILVCLHLVLWLCSLFNLRWEVFQLQQLILVSLSHCLSVHLHQHWLQLLWNNSVRYVVF